MDIRTKPSKVHDYASTQVGLGHLLDDNEFRTPPATYAEIDGEVHAMLRCGWARPRQVERAVGRLTSRMLSLRLTLSVFDAVYAFARKVGDRHARLWPAVAAELEHACALLPLMRADVTRRTAPCLVQCDACNDGDAVVYTESVQLDALRREALRPRGSQTAHAPARCHRSLGGKTGAVLRVRHATRAGALQGRGPVPIPARFCLSGQAY